MAAGWLNASYVNFAHGDDGPGRSYQSERGFVAILRGSDYTEVELH